jgi:hypothetical protein
MNPDHTNGDEYFYEDIDTKDDYSLGYTQLALMIWKEDSSGIRVIKDRFGGCISRLETEEELKEFMWIKLKSQKL